MDHKEKIEFLYQSINDTQATIRAIDIKIGFLFIVAFTPLSLSDNLISIACQLWNRNCFYKLSLDTDIVQELVLEKMKITYIREIKMHRYCRCVKFFYCWLFLGITLYIWSKIN